MSVHNLFDRISFRALLERSQSDRIGLGHSLMFGSVT
jgi:hypothetical protein